jgi:signal transduction histidine kinase
LRDLISKIQRVNEETRRIISDLRPSILDDLGIVPAINWFCREFRQTYSGVSIKQRIDIEEADVPDSLRTPVFRIVQEALNNVAKHSNAKFVDLSLQRSDDGIELNIRDDGQGFDLEANASARGSRRGLGLVSMRERAELSGGAFSIESAVGKGTAIRVSWPM